MYRARIRALFSSQIGIYRTPTGDAVGEGLDLPYGKI